MSELTKNQLKQDNQNSFPNNNTGYITPAILRDFNINMIDSLVDEVSYGADSASFNARINALDPSGSAASLLALEQATGSLNAYTASQNSFNSSATASIVALQSFSSSLDATFATDAQLTALSTSIAVTDLAQSQSIAALQSFSSSLDATFATDAQLSASVAALSSSVAVTDNAQSASIAALQSFSSSLDATFATDAQLSASVSSLSSSVAVTDLAQSASIAALQQFSSSLDATFATDAQLSASVAALSSSVAVTTNNLSSSVAVTTNNLSSSVAVTTNSLSSSIGNLSSSIAVTDLAQSASIAALQQFSSSLDATFATDAQLSASASTLQNNINSKLDSASFNSYTQSNDTKWNNLGNQSGSFITESETGSMSVASASFATTASFALSVSGFDSSSLVTSASFNAYTSSNDSKVNSLISKTGSYATTGSNIFQGQQFFQESVYVASDRILFTNKIQENSGGTIFFQGDLQAVNPATHNVIADLIGTASFATTASFALNATSVNTSSLVSTSSFNSYTASASTAVSGAINSATQSLSSSIAVTTNNLDLEVNQKLDSASFNSYTQSNDSKVNSLINATSSYVTEAESGSFVTSVVAGGTPKEITVTKGNGTTNTITVNNVDSASFSTTASFALNVTPFDSSSLVTTQSFNSYTQSNDSKVNSLISKTGSYATTGSNTFNGSQSITGSVSLTGTLTALSASITYLETIFETASVIYSSGSNQLGDELSDVQTLSGSVLVQGVLRVNGVSPILVGQTASYASASISASYAQTASFALNVTPTDVSMFLSKSIFDTYTGSAALGVSQSINAATQSLSSSFAVTTNLLDLEVNQKLDSSSFNSYTQSNDSKVNSLIAATSSYAISSSVATITGNSLVTASISGDTITFTKGNGSTFPIVVPTLSGSVPSGTVSSSAQITEFGFATTSSVSESVSALNAATSSYITSAQTASMTVLSASFAQTASFLLGSVASASFATSASFAQTASEARNVVLIARNGNASSLGAGTIVHITGASGDNPIFNTASFDSETLSANSLGVLRNTSPSGADVEVLVNGIVTGVNTDPALGYVAGDILYLSSSGQFTRVQPQAPLQIVTIGQVLRAQQNNGSIYVNITNGWELDELHNVAINGVADGDLLVYRSGSGLWTNSSSIELGNATTGSNTFVGNQVVSSSIIGVGDLYIQPTNQSTDFSNVSASVSGNIIFGAIFGDNQIQQTGSFVVSGSNNVVLVGKPTATSGYYSYVNGALNVVGAAVRLSTSSLLRPTMYNNIIQRGVTLNFTTSSFASPPNFGNNILYGNGTTNINHQSGSINFQSNLVGGGNIFTSTQNVTPTSTRAGITSNIFNGTQTFLHQSSSITLDRNIFNGLTAAAIRNDFSNSFADGLTVSRNIVNGNQVLIYNSGSTTAGSAQGNRSITDNLFGGANIIVSSSHIATNNNNANLVGAIVYGYNLNVSASSTTSTGGNVFVGRNNDTSSNLASTSDIIFAVGTGTSTSARKTGLWIDTGSLTTINGGLYVTQSQVTLTNSGSTPGTLALAVRSGSVEVTSPQGNGYFYTNLPITSSNLRINGDGIISDLFVSGVFGGNSTLNVAGNSYFTGSVNVNNNVSITGSLLVSGSTTLTGSVVGNVNALSISSNTASLNLNNGNFFTLQLVSGSSTHITPTNIKPGQTISLRLNTTGSGTVTFDSSIKQASGSAYVPTTTTGVDIITLISFDTQSLYISNLKNFN